jgi:uncharacterized membrane protein
MSAGWSRIGVDPASSQSTQTHDIYQSLYVQYLLMMRSKPARRMCVNMALLNFLVPFGFFLVPLLTAIIIIIIIIIIIMVRYILKTVTGCNQLKQQKSFQTSKLTLKKDE